MNTPAQIAEIFSNLGVSKAGTPRGRLFLLAVLAGMFIAFAGVGSTIANVVVNKLAGACVFPAGLAMVIVAGSELFTGDNLMLTAVLERRITAGAMFLTLLIVWVGNFLGSWLVAALAVGSGVLAPYAETVASVAAAKASLGFGEALLRGVLCNLLVCLAVWMAAAAKEPAGKIVGLFFPIMVFVLCGYEHCVANMYYLPAGMMAAARYGVAAEGLNWGSALIRNLIPVTIGNMAGGFAVALAYWTAYLRKARETV